MKTNILAFSLMAVLYGGVPARAGLIVDQSPPNGNALDMTDYRVADDFTLSGSYAIDAIDFWYFAQEQTDLSNLTYGIYQNSGGSLGTLLYTGTVTPSTSFDNTNDAYFAVASVGSLDLGSGTYWLELHAGSSFTDDNGSLEVDWATVNDNATAIALINTSGGLPNAPVDLSEYEQMAFQIDAQSGSSPPVTVPEPSVGLLAGPALAGLLGLSAFRARMRKKCAWRHR
jgi:hypothetical protein